MAPIKSLRQQRDPQQYAEANNLSDDTYYEPT